MDTTKTLHILAVVIILGGGAFFFSQNNQTAMMEKEGTMTEKEGIMMEKDPAVMQGETIPKEEGVMMEKKDEGVMMTKGSYEAYAPEKLARAETGDVILFFRASWCPTCRALDADIKANLGAIPVNVTILDIDYDKAKDLKQKYGVTYQHTMVQVDSMGNQIAKWSGSPTLAALLGNVK